MIAHQAHTAYLLLRIGAALAFLYPPLSALFGDPYTWLGYFPPFVQGGTCRTWCFCTPSAR